MRKFEISTAINAKISDFLRCPQPYNDFELTIVKVVVKYTVYILLQLFLKNIFKKSVDNYLNFLVL